MSAEVRVRFAPSPTGHLHVGGARTALFNWLYARHTQGQFVLRIEDTDRERSTEASVQAIFKAMEWLGIDWDEGPFYQSQRAAVYQEQIERLLSEDKAYYCTCTPEEIDAMREKAKAAGDKPRYDGTCREKRLDAQPNAVIRFKSRQTGTTVIEDAVKGPIVFQNNELDDFVLFRSDGSPTYNFAAVVDDIDMAINTIIQGSAADIIKIAMINIFQSLQKMESRMILQVHDELVFEYPQMEEEKLCELVQDKMENAVKLNVPLKVSFKKGKNWGDMSPL